MERTAQGSLAELPDAVWDVAVVGAGPAGAVAANLLAREGFSVLLADKQAFPREKVCGDGLIADATNSLSRLGLLAMVDERAYRARSSAVFSPSRVEIEIPGEYRTLKRTIFDNLLACAAADRGARFVRADVTALTVEASGTVALAVKGRATPVRARTCLVATGADLALLRPLGMVSRVRHSAVAVRAYLRSSFPLDRMIVSYDRSIVPGYAWIFPMGGGEFNVGCGIFYRGQRHKDWNLKTMLDSFLSDFPLGRELMNDGGLMTPLRGAPLRCGLEGSLPYRTGPVLAIGEAIGATFPFTGEGIGKAMETGELAASILSEALRRDDMALLARFPQAVRASLVPRYEGYRIAERWLSIPWLNDFVARRALRSSTLRRSMAGVINETVDPRAVFSIRGILASFWG